MFFFGDFTAFFAADFLAAGVFAAKDLTLPYLDFKVEHGGLNDATKHSVTESTELNPGCQQPFLFDKMSSFFLRKFGSP
jgi:hypothetical protein